MPITSTVIAGANPKSFIETGDTCSGTTLAANGGRCTVKVKFTPSSAGRRTALLDINDTGSVPPHLHQITLTGNASFPNNPKSVAGSVGCNSAHVRWVAPSATRFAGTIVIRNHAHYPTSIGDGTRVPHTSAGLATDKGLKHFTTYYYRVFATYHSLTHRGKLNYSQGTRLKERTGQICTPQNGARGVGTDTPGHLAARPDTARLCLRAPARIGHDQPELQLAHPVALPVVMALQEGRPPVRARPHLHVLPVLLSGLAPERPPIGHTTFTIK